MNNTQQDARADAIADYIARLEQADGNCDPFLIVAARETAAELLEAYMDHVRVNRAARLLIAEMDARVA